MSTPEPQYLAVGHIRRPHGVRGEVRAEVLTDWPERVEEHGAVYLASPDAPTDVRRYEVEKVRPHKDVLLLKLAGCDDRDQAEELRGMLVQVPVEEAVPLEEGEYYHHQLLELEVETEGGERLGRVAQILQTGANDVYVVRGPQGELLLPAVDEVIRQVDLLRGRMVVRPLPGMREDDESAKGA